MTLSAPSVGDRLINFESDPCGRLLRATGLDGILTYRYDRLGRVVAEAVDGRMLTTSCDAAGRRTGRTTPSGVASSYCYDSTGNRVTVETAGRSLSFGYDDAGREVERRLGRTFLLSHEHDRAGRITDQVLTSRHSPQALQRRTYAYRSDGRPIGASDIRGGHRRYELDAAGRVTRVDAARGWSETYSYDEAGNQTRGEWPESLPGADARGERVYTGARITPAGRVRY
nr:RHS repeat protein [Streptomyces sp. ms191]